MEFLGQYFIDTSSKMILIQRGSARPPTKPAAAKFFFEFFFAKMKDHIKKLLNPKYEGFLTTL